jgi:hypothetical protein
MQYFVQTLHNIFDWFVAVAGGSPGASDLEPSVRRAVADELTDELARNSPEIGEIDACIQTAKLELAKAEEKECFLGTRIYKYRTALDERRRVLDEHVPPLVTAEEDDDLLDEVNLEAGNHADHARLSEEQARLREKLEDDNAALENVIKSHRDILMHCEIVRRKLRSLQVRRSEIDGLRADYFEFIDAAEDDITNEDEVDHAAGINDSVERGLTDSLIDNGLSDH